MAYYQPTSLGDLLNQKYQSRVEELKAVIAERYPGLRSVIYRQGVGQRDPKEGEPAPYVGLPTPETLKAAGMENLMPTGAYSWARILTDKVPYVTGVLDRLQNPMGYGEAMASVAPGSQHAFITPSILMDPHAKEILTHELLHRWLRENPNWSGRVTATIPSEEMHQQMQDIGYSPMFSNIPEESLVRIFANENEVSTGNALADQLDRQRWIVPTTEQEDVARRLGSVLTESCKSEYWTPYSGSGYPEIPR